MNLESMLKQMGVGVDVDLGPSQITGKRSLPAKERAAMYNAAFPKAPLAVINGRIEGLWLMGNSYGNKNTYYGSYPGNYLKRVEALFPESLATLHLFSGSLPPGSYTRFDRPRPGDLIQGESSLFGGEEVETADPSEKGLVRGDAEKLSDNFPANSFDLIIADPPYSVEDAEHYGAPMVNRQKVISECRKILCDNGILVWLDQVWPMYRKDQWNLIGLIGIVISTNHRSRLLTILEKIG